MKAITAMAEKFYDLSAQHLRLYPELLESDPLPHMRLGSLEERIAKHHHLCVSPAYVNHTDFDGNLDGLRNRGWFTLSKDAYKAVIVAGCRVLKDQVCVSALFLQTFIIICRT